MSNSSTFPLAREETINDGWLAECSAAKTLALERLHSAQGFGASYTINRLL
jgi:hypothetical protein